MTTVSPIPPNAFSSSGNWTTEQLKSGRVDTFLCPRANEQLIQDFTTRAHTTCPPYLTFRVKLLERSDGLRLRSAHPARARHW